jgi:phosphoribosylformylglycinamidine synthase II
MTPITPELVAQHQITPDEYEKIVRLLGRTPSITELGIFSVMWSEHCSYKSSRALLKGLPTKGPRVLQGPGENAGIIDIGGGWACAFKIESHNHPSFVEPFQGAATGVGGILRDIFTMGARPIAVMDSLRFGPLTGPDGDRNARILRGVVGGIGHYGNAFGVPTVGGEAVFEPCYGQNPLVNAFALGIFRADGIFRGNASGVGNSVIYVGARTGRDGIHGATMASAEFSADDEESRAKRPNVQVGDPFMEKLLLEACLEAMKTGAVVGIQDMGAAGLTCSTCEMGGRAGTGVEIEIDLVPQRETGMTPYEIMLSESQERMLLVADGGREQEVLAVFHKWGLQAVVIGSVTADPHMRVKHHGQVVADIPNAALTDEAPVYHRPQQAAVRKVPMNPPVEIPEHSDYAADLKKLLASPTIASKRWIWEQYDYSVCTNTVAGPGGDAAVLRLKETGGALAMSLDGNGRYCSLDAREGAKHAVAEACRNVSATGAEPVAATNCLNFGSPENPETMWQFAEAVAGMSEACRVLETPITGGNVSFYNETLGEPIYPTPVMGIVGLLDDAAKAIGSCFRGGERIVALLGEFGDAKDAVRFGSSEYAKTVLGSTWGLPPALDLSLEKRVQACCRELVQAGVIESAHDASDGGIAVALAECCWGGVGAMVVLPGRPSVIALFGETASRYVVSVPRESWPGVEAAAARHRVAARRLGFTGGDRLEINGAISASVAELREIWETSLGKLLSA